MAVLRGDVMPAEMLKAYARQLAQIFEGNEDILATLHELVLSPRGEFEAKIPALGDLIGMIRQRRTAIARQNETQRLLAEEAAYLKDVREHPENYVSVKDLWREAEMRAAAKRSAAAQPAPSSE